MSARRRRAVALLAALLACALLLPARRRRRPAGTPSRVRPGRSEDPEPRGEARVEARAWALIDARTGEVLVSHAGAERLPIASTTKLMTAYVAMKEMPLEQDRQRRSPTTPNTASR